MRDMHITLGDDVLAQLNTLSRKLAQSRNLLVRQAVTEFIARKEREAMAREMKSYAQNMAPHSAQFVEESAAHVDQMLREHTQW